MYLLVSVGVFATNIELEKKTPLFRSFARSLVLSYSLFVNVYARRHTTLHFTVFAHQRPIANSALFASIFFQTDFHCFYVRLNTIVLLREKTPMK